MIKLETGFDWLWLVVIHNQLKLMLSCSTNNTKETYPHWSNLTSFVMTYHDHSHPIKTNTNKSAKNYAIGLKLSKYDHMAFLISLKRPTLTCSNLISLVMTYHDHGHPIKTNSYKSTTNWDIELKLSEYDLMGYLISLRRPTFTWSNLTSFVMTYHDHGHPILTDTYKSAKNCLLYTSPSPRD